MINKLSFSLIFAFAAVLVTLTSCEKDFKSTVPDVPFTYVGYLTQPDLSSLTILTAVKIPNYGYRRHGIILYRNEMDSFWAFDATCPNDLVDGSVVIDKDKPHEAVCPICKAVYSLMNGGVTAKGEPLKRYNTSFNGTTITVYN